MVKIEPFQVEEWMNKYEVTPNVLNIAETCAASISLEDLAALSEDKNLPSPVSNSLKLTYGPIRGSPALLERLASLYSVRVATPLPPSNILITPGAIAANFLVLYTLIGPGDHVICIHPTYQQLYSVPASLGAEVSLLKLKKGKSYIPSADDLKALLRPNTKLIILNNPSNPLGSVTPKSVLQAIVEVAREHGIIIFCDEVYRPLFHSISPSSPDFPPSLISLGYEKTIITSSMSKAYSLAGIRLGWIASRSPQIIEAIASSRDYTTISVSPLSDAIASYALSPAVLHPLLSRNLTLARTNLALLSSFIDSHSEICSWTPPTGGTTALIKFEKMGSAVDDEKFCIDLIEKTKVMLLPAARCFGKEWRGYARIGFCCETEVLREALGALGRYIEKELGDED